jgi:mRNA interferase YafQ
MSVKRFANARDRKVIGAKLEIIIEYIRQRKVLESKYKDHALHGAYVGYRECHIKPNVLLLYEVDDVGRYITLVNIGSHSELFGS